MTLHYVAIFYYAIVFLPVVELEVPGRSTRMNPYIKDNGGRKEW
jgi:hypothetical protein